MALANEKGKIVLGGEEFPIHAFTLDELQAVIPAINTYHTATFSGWSAKAIASAETIGAAKECLAVAMKKTVVEVGAIPATADEVFTAMESVAKVAGLASLGELIVAMMPPQMPQNLTGTGFTPTS